LKNVPNVSSEGDVFSFSDYVSKNVGSWGMVPSDVEDEESYVEEVAEKMYNSYQWLGDEFPEYVTVERSEDAEMYLCGVTVDVPEDSGVRERVAEQVAESILSRMQI
jgi:hypothetical protein